MLETLHAPAYSVAEAAAELGLAEAFGGRYEAAGSHCEKAIATEKLDPRYAIDARFGLAMALASLGTDPKRAVLLANEAAATLDHLTPRTPLEGVRRTQIRDWLSAPGSAGAAVALTSVRAAPAPPR